MTSYTVSGREPDFGDIPPDMCGGITRYIERGIPPGHFLTAVICNDLKQACARADETNRFLLFEYVKFFYNHAPAECWGSDVRFDQWVGHRGLLGPDRDRLELDRDRTEPDSDISPEAERS